MSNPDESIPVLIFRLIVSPISIVGNSIILYIAFRFEKFRSSIANCLISLLAAGELLIGIGLLVRAFYTVYNAPKHLTTYPRLTCLEIGMGTLIGLIYAQVILLSMAIDRLIAVMKPIAYYNSKTMIRAYITVVIALLCSGVFVFLSLWKLPNTPAEECSVGGAAPLLFTIAWAYFGILIFITIFGIYVTTVVFLIRRHQIIDHNVALSIQKQKKVFISISLILLSYLIFWCLPLFAIVVVEIAFNSDIVLLGYISLAIGLCSSLNSCVGIFIYVAKHQELREYFFKIFPRLAKIKGTTKVLQVSGSNSQLVGLTPKNLLRRSPMPQAIIN